jgi:YlmC/YmxH family sporulation protein
MKLSELVGKEIINLADGERLGIVSDTELVIDSETGRIDSIVVPRRGGFSRKRNSFVIPWRAIKRIGTDLIIVDVPVDMT